MLSPVKSQRARAPLDAPHRSASGAQTREKTGPWEGRQQEDVQAAAPLVTKSSDVPAVRGLLLSQSLEELPGEESKTGSQVLVF